MSVRSHAFVAPARLWPAGLARDALGPLLVALALAGTLLVALLRADGFNPTGPAHIGDRWDGRQYWTPTTRVEHGIGYDGQFFFYLAHDPFLTGGDPAVFLDRPAYRAGRLLYPLIVWALTLGRPEAVPWGLLGVNLVMVLVGTAAAVDVLRSLGASRWLALGFALNPAILIGLVADWMEHGTRMVLVVNPRCRTVAVHRPGQPVQILTEDGTLDGEDVVPGWSLPIRELFAPA